MDLRHIVQALRQPGVSRSELSGGGDGGRERFSGCAVVASHDGSQASIACGNPTFFIGSDNGQQHEPAIHRGHRADFAGVQIADRVPVFSSQAGEGETSQIPSGAVGRVCRSFSRGRLERDALRDFRSNPEGFGFGVHGDDPQSDIRGLRVEIRMRGYQPHRYQGHQQRAVCCSGNSMCEVRLHNSGKPVGCGYRTAANPPTQ